MNAGRPPCCRACRRQLRLPRTPGVTLGKMRRGPCPVGNSSVTMCRQASPITVLRTLWRPFGMSGITLTSRPKMSCAAFPRGLILHPTKTGWLSCRHCSKNGKFLEFPNDIGVKHHFARGGAHNPVDSPPPPGSSSMATGDAPAPPTPTQDAPPPPAPFPSVARARFALGMPPLPPSHPPPSAPRATTPSTAEPRATSPALHPRPLHLNLVRPLPRPPPTHLPPLPPPRLRLPTDGHSMLFRLQSLHHNPPHAGGH